MPKKPTRAATSTSRKSAGAPAGAPQRTARAPRDGSDAHAARAARVLRHFRMIFNAVRNHFRSVERKAGIPGSQLWALSVVHSSPGAGVTQLARAMSVHQSTASNLVRALAELELVVAAREADDRRAVQLYVTAKGQKVLAKAPGPQMGILPDALDHLDDRMLARLDRDLAEIVQRIGAESHLRNVLMSETG